MSNIRNTPRPSGLRRRQGFTLIEMLVAIAIFAMLSMGAYQVLQGVLQSNDISEQRGQALKQLQRAMLVIERDFQQMLARQNRNDDELTAMPLQVGKFLFESDDYGIAFSRSGWRNPMSQLPRSSLQRVSYRLKENNLERLTFVYLDPVVGQTPKEQILLTGVEALTFEFYHAGKWVEAWTDKKALPEGIKMTLQTQGFGEIRRSFLLPKATVTSGTMAGGNNETLKP